MLDLTEEKILADWIATIDNVGTRVRSVLSAEEQARHSRDIVHATLQALEASDASDLSGNTFDALKAHLVDLSMLFAERRLTPSEAANYVFSLKDVIFEALKAVAEGDELARKVAQAGKFIDQMALVTFEAYTAAREHIIKGQAHAIGELAAPVVRVWDGIIALVLVGSIDSARAKDIMENLLEAVVTYSADVVIIDITGVSVVDTQVANRLMRTVESVRLLGTKSIITGINPVIAQTLVQLGIELKDLSTKSSLQAGLKQAFRDIGLVVSKPERV